MATGFNAGQVLTAATLNAWLPVSAVKTGPTARAATTVLAADPDLSITLLAGARYLVETNLGILGPTAADIQVAYVRTGTVTQVSGREYVAPELNTTTTQSTLMRNQKSGASTPDAAAIYGTVPTSWAVVREAMWLDGGSSGGTLTLHWAQSVSDATATQLTGFIIATRMA